ncbi:unnamed protein product, partial [Brachionus calyciflorus]
KAETLLAIIYEHVIPGSIIYSDQWAAYNKIGLLHDSNIRHQTVNHSIHFVDPLSFTCTNKIESLWNIVKVRFRDMRGCNKMYIQTYLDEFMWRWNNGLSRSEVYIEIFNVIKHIFNNSYVELEEHIKKIEINEEIGEIIDLNDENDDELTEISTDDSLLIKELSDISVLSAQPTSESPPT